MMNHLVFPNDLYIHKDKQTPFRKNKIDLWLENLHVLNNRSFNFLSDLFIIFVII